MRLVSICLYHMLLSLHTISDGILCALLFAFFFFQAEDGIRDLIVTGVQTCALPICAVRDHQHPPARGDGRRRRARQAEALMLLGPSLAVSAVLFTLGVAGVLLRRKIGRASCRERV